MNVAELRSLVRHMRDHGVETLDVRERHARLRIRLDPAHPARDDGAPAGRDGAIAGRGAAARGRGRALVRADVAGTFADAHPLRPEPFAAIGTPVRAGQVLGLLKVGVLYRPVLARMDGVLERALAGTGAAVPRGAPLFEIRKEEST